MSGNEHRPLIGVTTSEIRQAHSISRTPQSEPPRRELALGVAYTDAVEAAGGAPVVVPPLHASAITTLLDRLDGLCLSGGPDLDPATYGERPHPRLGPTEPNADAFELELTRQAFARGMPILAICRGEQALNVALGGSLHQHLPDIEGTLDHRQEGPGGYPAHAVRLDDESRTATALGAAELRVNSFHHQAIREVAPALQAVGWSPDGIVEAVEAPNQSFCMGVQWHAEAMSAGDSDRRLFSAFVEAAIRARAAGVGSRSAA